MSLTPTQLQALKTDIVADPILNAMPLGEQGASDIAGAYNLQADPIFWVWRTDIPISEIKQKINWVEYIATSIGKKQAFELMISDGVIDASSSNVQQGFQDIFTGTTLINFILMAKRLALRGEVLLAIGTGTLGSPGTLTVEGTLGFRDVRMARNLP